MKTATLLQNPSFMLKMYSCQGSEVSLSLSQHALGRGQEVSWQVASVWRGEHTCTDTDVLIAEFDLWCLQCPWKIRFWFHLVVSTKKRREGKLAEWIWNHILHFGLDKPGLENLVPDFWITADILFSHSFALRLTSVCVDWKVTKEKHTLASFIATVASSLATFTNVKKNFTTFL